MKSVTLLTIDTSTKFASVSLSYNDELLHNIHWFSDQNHSLELMPNIKTCLDFAGMSVSEITHLAVALGPGGFSSIRVGISTALGISAPSSIITLGIPTFLLEFYEHRNSYETLFAFIPAGRNRYAWKKYEETMTYTPDGVDTPEQIAQILSPTSFICGESANELSDIIKFDNVVAKRPPSRSSNNFVKIVNEVLAKGLLNHYRLIEPIYSRPPSITKTKKHLPKWRIS